MPRLSDRQDADRLAAIAAAQRQVATRAQLLAAGFDSDAVRRRVATGRWQRIGPAVVLHNGPIDELALAWAGILSVQGPAALAGRSGAKRYGLRGFEPGAIEIVVPRGATPPAITGVRWHESRRFGEADIASPRGLAVVRAPRAIVDAASWTPSPRVACALVAASVQQRVVSARALRRELAAAGLIQHRKQLHAVVADIEGGADSLSEIDLVALARRAGLPPPRRQAVRCDRFGRRRYLDADFGGFVVEVDGGVHLKPLTYWDDALRQNELVLGGDRVLRFPTIAIRLEPDVVIAQLQAAARLFGCW